MRPAFAALLVLSACGPRRDPALDRLARSRQLTAWLYAGAFDSLPAGTIVDLAGDGDSVLVRWFVDRRIDSLGREWPSDVILTLEGKAAGTAFLERLEATYGREQEMTEEGFYPCYYPICQRPHTLEYNRIVKFTGVSDHTLTVAWLWTNDSLVGGWVIPTRGTAPSQFEAYETKTALRLPFEGEWVVLWGGRKPQENYHVTIPPLRFASDFVVDSGGSLHRSDGRSNDDYFCYGRPILAPAVGRIGMALDSFAENIPGRSPPGYRGPGNFVTIEHDGGEVSVLAHLRRGSVRVGAGQEVQVGDTIGECGNNGESVLPHLHYQLQLDPRPGQRVVPAFFRNYRADTVLVERGEPRRGQRISHRGRP